MTLAISNGNTVTLDLSTLSTTDSQTVELAAAATTTQTTLTISGGNSISLTASGSLRFNQTATNTLELVGGPGVTTLPSGTATDTTLRWDGTDWVTNTALLSNGTNQATVTTDVTVQGTSTLATTTLTAGLIDGSGNVGTAGQILTSTGTSTQWSSDLSLTGTLTVANLVVSETLTVQGTSTLATTTVEGDLSVTGTTTTENLTVSNTLTVLGPTNLVTTTITGPLTTTSTVTNNGPVTNNATTTLNGPLVDASGNVGDPGQILSSTGTSTQWIDNNTPISGTVTNSTLRWNGSAWVESETILQSDTGTATLAANTTVTGTLAVTGNTTLTNDLTVQGTTTLATTTLGAVLRDYDGDVGTAGQVLSTTGTSTQWVDNTPIASGTTTNSTLCWNGTDWVETTTLLTADTAGGTATLAANTTVTGTLEVSDNATITGAFVVENNTTVTGTLAVTGNTTLTNDLTVQGTTTLATTTLGAVLRDYDGDVGTAGQVLSTTGTSTQWIDNSAPTTGTTTNSTLRWNGTDWVEIG